MLRYCTVFGCQRKCILPFCFLHNQGNDNRSYSCHSRLLEYCGPAELAKLAPYFPLKEPQSEWNRFSGDIHVVVWKGLTLSIHDDGSLNSNFPFTIEGKFRSISTNGTDIVVLTENYSFYWYNTIKNTIQKYSLAPRRIIQVGLQRDRLIYLTDRMELFSYTFNGEVQQLFPEQTIRLFYVQPLYANIFYITSQNELYNDNENIGCEIYQRFIELDNDLHLALQNGDKCSYSVTVRFPIGPTGILL